MALGCYTERTSTEAQGPLGFSQFGSLLTRRQAAGIRVSDGTVWLWDTVTGILLQRLKGHSGWVCSVAFSPDDKQLASAAGNRDHPSLAPKPENRKSPRRMSACAE